MCATLFSERKFTECGDNMKLNRLLEITTILLNRSGVTARELAERFGVSTRTIYRDIDDLSSAGVPVYATKGNGGGISLLEGYTLEKSLLSQEEIDRLITSVKTMSATKYPGIEALFEKLGASFKSESKIIHVDFGGWGDRPEDAGKFELIESALIDGLAICFEYVDASGNMTERVVEPIQLVFQTHDWYLNAFCLLRNDERMFKLTRMKGVSTTNQPVRRTILNTDEACFDEARDLEMADFSGEVVELHLRIDRRYFGSFCENFSRIQHTEADNGTVEARISAYENHWLYSYLFSFGSGVEILEPTRIRGIIIDRAKEVLECYGLI